MDKEFLYDMLRTPSVSGHEIALQKKVIQHMEPVADEILTDATGDVISVLNPHAEAKVLLCGHIDEIGFLVTRICEDGMLKVTKAGGIHPVLYSGDTCTGCLCFTNPARCRCDKPYAGK